MFRIISSVVFILFCGSFSQAQLNGNYTVGGTSPDYSTLKEVCDSIISLGISGPVVIDIRDGIYTDDTLRLTNYAGASEINTITFQSESMDASAVELVNTGYQSAYFQGDSVSNIIVQYLTMTNNGTTDNVFVLEGEVHDVELSNCVLNGVVTTSTANSRAVIRLNGGFPGASRNVLITNNEINHGSDAIRSDETDSLTITYNTISEPYDEAADVYNCYQFIFNHNSVRSDSSSNYADVINIYSVHGNSEVSYNEIYRFNQSSGDVFGAEYLGGTILIHNNIISMTGGNASVWDGDYNIVFLSFINNTIVCGGALFDAYFDHAWELYNNILISTGGSKIFDIDENEGAYIPSTGYNAVYTSGTFGSADFPYSDTYATLADFQSQTGQGVGSFELLDPMFALDTFDLHVCSDLLIGAGYGNTSVIWDIDGEPRNSNIPSIGADYFTTTGSLFDDSLVLCLGNAITLDAGNADNYLWSTTDTTQTIDVVATGEYSVEWTHSCGTYYDTVTVVAAEVPSADFSVNQSYFTFNFTNLSANGIDYHWDFGDGNTSSEENPTHIYNAEGNYTVTLTVTNDCSSDTHTFDVAPSYVGLDESTLVDFSLFPNPTNGTVNVVIPQENASEYELTVTDIKGRNVQTITATGTSAKVDLTNQPNGVYLIQVSSDNGTATQRLVKI